MHYSGEPATYTYVIQEPFERALRLLHETLADEGLRVSLELDVSGSIKDELGVKLAPCRLLGIDSPLALLEATAVCASAALFLPLHLVVSGGGQRTLLHLASSAAIRHAGVPAGVKTPVGKLQARLSQVLQRISGRQALCVS